jgi:hypothetical protein
MIDYALITLFAAASAMGLWLIATGLMHAMRADEKRATVFGALGLIVASLLIAFVAVFVWRVLHDRPSMNTGYTSFPKLTFRALNPGSHHARFVVPLETRRVREVQIPHLPASREARPGASA